MFCTKCGAVLEDGTKFCTSCGSVVEQETVSAGAQSDSSPAATTVVGSAAGASAFEPKQPVPTQALPNQGAYAQQNAYAAQQPAYAAQQPAYMPQQQQPAAQQPQKKSKLPIVIAIAAVVIVLLAIAIASFILTDGFNFNSSSSSSTTTSSSSAASDEASTEIEEEETVETATPGTVTLSAYTTGGELLTGTVRQDANGYVLPDSSSREYTYAELQAMNLTPAELCIAWNEPFARLGYHFGNSSIANYFESTDWYVDKGIKPNATGAGAKNNETLRTLADSTEGAYKWKDLVLDNNAGY